MTGYTTQGWGELFLAEAGASAALGGVLLVAVLMVSTFALVPDQPRWVLGGEVLVVGIAA